MLKHVVNNQYLIFISLFILMNKKFYLNVIFLINSIHHIFFLFIYNLYDDERLDYIHLFVFFYSYYVMQTVDFREVKYQMRNSKNENSKSAILT